MRPPEFTGGNRLRQDGHRRSHHRFNEAAGIHRRKRRRVVALGRARGAASMRPPEFTGGNPAISHHVYPGKSSRFNEAAGIHRRKPGGADSAGSLAQDASMRPPEFTGGNVGPDGRLAPVRATASMRPPEFTGGNPAREPHNLARLHVASMRPPEFTGGNLTLQWQGSTPQPCFNEAAGIHRRKPARSARFICPS